MKIRIEGNDSEHPYSWKVINADTNKPIENVSAFTLHVDCNEMFPSLTLHFVNDIEIVAQLDQENVILVPESVL